MRSKVAILMLLTAFLVSGCGFVAQRAHKIQSKYPHWDQATVQKIAARRVEIGMTDQMVLESLGAPDRTAVVGEEEEWSYGVNRSVGEGGIVRALVYFVYFKEGRVVRTTGSWSRLGYWIYSTSVD